MYVAHLTLATGHLSRIQRGDVAGETLARVVPWLSVLVESGSSAPLPVASLSGYTALATVLDGALVATISGQALPSGPMAGVAPPLVTLGVAKRSRHGATLWPMLTGPTMPPTKAGLQRPAEPWCGAVIWPTLALHPDAAAWLGDLERCIAWVWCTRPADG